MLDRNVLKPSASHDFRRLYLRVLLASATHAVCVVLAVVISLLAVVFSAPTTGLEAYGSKVLNLAGDLNACPPQPQAVVDDFSGPAGAPPSPQLWKYELGGGDGEADTDSPRNASLDGNGNLAIVAIHEPFHFPGYPVVDYTGAAIDTHGHLDFCYGTITARIKLPTGRGLRPAFWLVGSDVETVGWPQCGEIDVLDVDGSFGVAGLHGPGGYTLFAPVPFDFGADWHEYALDWRRDKITISMDGHDFASWTPESLPPGAPWTFNDHPMYVVLDMAVDGADNSVLDSSTRFPATMLVDWVRYTPAT
jgi:Glycosyl hydrolases family 16